MEFLEKVEKLRNKANISYEEAKSILNETDGDLLEAMIMLEKQGRLDPPPSSNESIGQYVPRCANGHKGQEGAHDAWRGFWRWIKSLFAKGNRNNLRIKKNDNVIASMPVTVFVAALVFAFWIAVPLLIAGLFCGCSYSFTGPDLERENINRAWDKASQMAESIKEDIKKEMDSGEDNK